jgi:hypothetical protein
MGMMRNADNTLLENHEGKRLLGRPRYWWEGNTRMDLRKAGCEGVVCIHLAQDSDQWWALVKIVTNVRVP